MKVLKKILKGIYYTFLLILFTLVLTNPSEDSHRQQVKNIFRDELSNLKGVDLATRLVAGGTVGAMEELVTLFVTRDNYLFFSLTRYYNPNNSAWEIIGIGVLGFVYIPDEEINSVKAKLDRTEF